MKYQSDLCHSLALDGLSRIDRLDDTRWVQQRLVGTQIAKQLLPPSRNAFAPAPFEHGS